MGFQEDANECARRWIACNDRRVKKGKPFLNVTFEYMSEFSNGIVEDGNEERIGEIVDLALEKVLEYERRVRAAP